MSSPASISSNPRLGPMYEEKRKDEQPIQSGMDENSDQLASSHGTKVFNEVNQMNNVKEVTAAKMTTILDNSNESANSPSHTAQPPAKKAKMTHVSDSALPPTMGGVEEKVAKGINRSPSSSVPPALSSSSSSSSTSRAATPIVVQNTNGSTKKKAKKQTSSKTAKKVRKTSTVNKKAKNENIEPLNETLESENIQEVPEEEELDTKLYCICQSLYDEERMMIACDRCDDWYHTVCMKMKDEQAELVDVFICPNCERGTEKRTTWKPKCDRSECTHAALRPLSKYCSERCGVIVASQKIKAANTASLATTNGNGSGRTTNKTLIYEKALAEKMLKLPRIVSAKRREGIVIWTPEHNDDRLNWLKSLVGERAAESISSLVRTESSQTPSSITSITSEEQRSIILPQIEEIVRLNEQMKRIHTKRNTVNEGLDVLASRIKLLHLAEDRASTLEPIRGEEAETTTTKTNKKGGRSKKPAKPTTTNAESNGGNANANRGQPRCGYDERLHWDDERFRDWSYSMTGKGILNEEKPLDGKIEEGEEKEKESQSPSDPSKEQEIQSSICGNSKRKCKKHADWSIVRGADFDFDRERQMQFLSVLSHELQEIEDRLNFLKLTLKQSLIDEDERRKLVDERLARTLANEGSRRTLAI